MSSDGQRAGAAIMDPVLFKSRIPISMIVMSLMQIGFPIIAVWGYYVKNSLGLAAIFVGFFLFFSIPAMLFILQGHADLVLNSEYVENAILGIKFRRMLWGDVSFVTCVFWHNPGLQEKETRMFLHSLRDIHSLYSLALFQFSLSNTSLEIIVAEICKYRQDAEFLLIDGATFGNRIREILAVSKGGVRTPISMAQTHQM